MALLLRKKGITRVRPLLGGIDAWLTNHFGSEDRLLVMGNRQDTFLLMNWDDFRPFRGDYYIERGKTLPFTVAFIFDREHDIATSKQWKFIITDYADKNFTTTIDHPEFLTMRTKTFVFDCYLKTADDVQELLKDGRLNLKNIQTFLTSKYGYKPEWYD